MRVQAEKVTVIDAKPRELIRIRKVQVSGLRSTRFSKFSEAGKWQI